MPCFRHFGQNMNIMRRYIDKKGLIPVQKHMDALKESIKRIVRTTPQESWPYGQPGPLPSGGFPALLIEPRKARDLSGSAFMSWLLYNRNACCADL